ncbi:MAG: hypothetical protein WC821_02265 [archaeon]|jgi:hypothetical protein
MEQTLTIKGIALFATLTGIYQWVGNGTSFYDIMVILFATALVISLDSEKKQREIIKTPVEIGDNPAEQTTKDHAKVFFCEKKLPLSKFSLVTLQ